MYFVELLLICVTLLVMQKSLSDNQQKHNTDKSDADLNLAPVEIAYLSQNGDTSFALIVLVFDMLHREIKTHLSTLSTRSKSGELSLEKELELELDLELAPRPAKNLPALPQEKAGSTGSHYEDRLKSIITSSVRNWGEKKVQTVTGKMDIKKDPIGFVRKLPFLYKLLSAALKGTAQEILKDPRHIRKYFSKTGLMRIIAEVGASGYKESFEQELKTELLRKGLLLEESQRHKLARSYFICFAVAQIAFIALILQSVPNLLNGAVIFTVAGASAFVVKTALGARSFIPLYADLSEVLNNAPRKNFRIAALAIFLRLVNFALNGLSVIAFMILLLTGSTILYFTQTVHDTTTYMMLLTMMGAQYLAAAFFFEGYRLSLHQSATPHALRHIKQLKERYRDYSSIDALKSVLTDSQYKSEMSYLLAIYGLETLFFI